MHGRTTDQKKTAAGCVRFNLIYFFLVGFPGKLIWIGRRASNFDISMFLAGSFELKLSTFIYNSYDSILKQTPEELEMKLLPTRNFRYLNFLFRSLDWSA